MGAALGTRTALSDEAHSDCPLAGSSFVGDMEILGGLFLFEAENLDRALDLAARIPVARMGGAVEVRPLVER